MYRWTYNGRSEVVTDEQYAAMKKDIAFRKYEWQKVIEAKPAEKSPAPKMAPPPKKTVDEVPENLEPPKE